MAEAVSRAVLWCAQYPEAQKLCVSMAEAVLWCAQYPEVKAVFGKL